VKPENLADLTDGRAHGTDGPGNHERFTAFRLTDLGQARPCGKTRHAQDAKCPGRVPRALAQVDQASAVRQRVVLPAAEGHDPVAKAKAVHARSHDSRNVPPAMTAPVSTGAA